MDIPVIVPTPEIADVKVPMVREDSGLEEEEKERMKEKDISKSIKY